MSSDDYETIDKHKAPDDITSLITGLGIQKLKLSFFIFILFIFISSDVFVDRILSNKKNTYVEGRVLTSKGVMVQGLILSVCYIIITLLVENDYL